MPLDVTLLARLRARAAVWRRKPHYDTRFSATRATAGKAEIRALSGLTGVPLRSATLIAVSRLSSRFFKFASELEQLAMRRCRGFLAMARISKHVLRCVRT